MSDKIEVRMHIYSSSTCEYCGNGFSSNDLINLIYDGEPVHMTCVVRKEEERIARGEAVRCGVCDGLIVNPDKGSFENRLYNGIYIHPLCPKPS